METESDYQKQIDTAKSQRREAVHKFDETHQGMSGEAREKAEKAYTDPYDQTIASAQKGIAGIENTARQAKALTGVEVNAALLNDSTSFYKEFKADVGAVGKAKTGIELGLSMLGGELVGPLVKLFRAAKAVEAAEVAKTGASEVEDLVTAAQKAYPGKAGVTELHHITPKYLGGAADGPLAPLDAAYHQQITNEFRSLWPYGGAKPNPQQLQEIMQKVYNKYPIPPGN